VLRHGSPPFSFGFKTDRRSGGVSEECDEFFNCEAGIKDNPNHCIGIDRIVAGQRQCPFPVGQNDVSALTGDVETGSFKNPNRIEMIDSRELRLF